MATNVVATRPTGVEGEGSTSLDLTKVYSFLGEVSKRAESWLKKVQGMKFITQADEDAAAEEGRKIRSTKEGLARDLQELTAPLKAGIAEAEGKI